MVKRKEVNPVRFEHGRLVLLDQRKLPAREQYVHLDAWGEVVEAIRTMVVRGAPAIGLAGAFGVVLAAQEATREGLAGLDWRRAVAAAAAQLEAARPTAVNLGWAIREVMVVLEAGGDALAMTIRAEELLRADIAGNRRIGELGGRLLPDGAKILTHCNAGALATGGYGTALGVVRWAWEHQRLARVWATETRPVLQGSRLTAWELSREGIPYTLIVDSAAAVLMRRGEVSAVVVGADRIAGNGDVANKIGTYALAVAARWHNVPFYVAAPRSTFDARIGDGRQIAIEERDPGEVTSVRRGRIAPRNAEAFNPAFDITPSELVSAIITEVGVLRAPYPETIARMAGQQQ